MITAAKLKEMMPFATADNIAKFTEPLNQVLERFEINTPQRIACFMAQLAHESGSLRYVRELASGQAYEGRKDLGNTQPGDGVKFKGRGLIQVTGRANYAAVSRYFCQDFVGNPTLLEHPMWAAMTAGWYWESRKLNELADAGDFRRITIKINGGLNGYEDRLKHYSRCKKALGI